jgi:hypothetical protein
MAPVMRRSGLGRGAQSDQQAQGQDSTHHIFSEEQPLGTFRNLAQLLAGSGEIQPWFASCRFSPLVRSASFRVQHPLIS